MNGSGMKLEVATAVIFGAGGMGRRLWDVVSRDEHVNVIAFVDNDVNKHGKQYAGVTIYPPSALARLRYDYLYFGTQMGVNEISVQIEELGVPSSKIRRDYIDTITNARKLFVERYGEMVSDKGILGSVAEAGVYRGEFARCVNRIFPTRKIYLFDTFAGFDQKDFAYEKDESLLAADHFKNTSVDYVLSKMPYPEKCVVRQGYFPDTLRELEDEFVFVSLDLDLYKPTLCGLEYFYPRMASGGCILIHDYFTPSYPNVRKAVNDYQSQSGNTLSTIPIGDDVSVAIIKN
jgi:O-methyltransferase